MEFMLTPEQRELQSSARAALAARFPLARLAHETVETWDPAAWAQFAELGWLGVCVPEEHGGVGLGFVETSLLLEELGYALYAGPFFSTVVLALPALSPEEQAKVAEGEARWSAEVDGLVPDLEAVEQVVTATGAAPAQGEVLDSIDPTRPLARLTPGERTPLPGAVDMVRACAGLAAEAVGIAQRALDLSVEYAKERQQFGRVIGTYQGISHPLADTYADVELARSLAWWAAWCIDEQPAEAAAAAVAAKAFATDAAVAACERGIQTHGGIGFTWEHPLHRFYKRALAIQAFGGYPSAQRAQLRAHVLSAD